MSNYLDFQKAQVDSSIGYIHGYQMSNVLLLYINNDKAKNGNQSKGLQAQEPQHKPKENDHYWFHNSFSKIHPCEAHVEEVFVQFAKKCSHLFVVITNGFARVVLWFFSILLALVLRPPAQRARPGLPLLSPPCRRRPVLVALPAAGTAPQQLPGRAHPTADSGRPHGCRWSHRDSRRRREP